MVAVSLLVSIVGIALVSLLMVVLLVLLHQRKSPKDALYTDVATRAHKEVDERFKAIYGIENPVARVEVFPATDRQVKADLNQFGKNCEKRRFRDGEHVGATAEYTFSYRGSCCWSGGDTNKSAQVLGKIPPSDVDALPHAIE